MAAASPRKPIGPGGKGGIAAAAVLVIAAPIVALLEGTVLTTYQDIVGIPTICTGHTGPDVRMGMRFTAAECRDLLDADLVAHAVGLDKCIDPPLAAHEAAAVLSWGFNVGVNAACSSTLVRMINAGTPANGPGGWCAQLDRWVYARGWKVNGLVKRRAKERALCEGNLTP